MIRKAAQPSKAWTEKSSVDGRLKSARLALKKIGPHDPHVHADSGDPSGTISSPRPIYRATRPIPTPCATLETGSNSFSGKSRTGACRGRNWGSTWCVSSGRRSSHSTGDRSRRSVPTISWILRRRDCGSACSRIFRRLIWTTPRMISSSRSGRVCSEGGKTPQTDPSAKTREGLPGRPSPQQHAVL
jgi:hypothetical protein